MNVQESIGAMAWDCYNAKFAYGRFLNNNGKRANIRWWGQVHHWFSLLYTSGHLPIAHSYGPAPLSSEQALASMPTPTYTGIGYSIVLCMKGVVPRKPVPVECSQERPPTDQEGSHQGLTSANQRGVIQRLSLDQGRPS